MRVNPAVVVRFGGAQAKEMNESARQARDGPGAIFINHDILIQ